MHIKEILAKIKNHSYTRVEGTTITICNIETENGFQVFGKSACLNPAEFDEEKGKTFAYDDAVSKLWELEGYLAMENKWCASKTAQGNRENKH